MARGKAKHNARKVGLGEVGDTFMMGRGGPQGVGNVLQGSGTSDTTFWILYLRTFGRNREEGIGNTQYVYWTDHGEASVTNTRQDMGDSQGGSSAGDYRQSWQSGWRCNQYLKCAQERRDMREEWWRQEEAEKQLRSTLAEISPEAKRRRRRGKRAIYYDTGERGEAERELWMLGRRCETPGWEDELVW